MDGEGRVRSESLLESRTEPKVLVAQKRGTVKVDEAFVHKKVKMKDNELVFHAEGNERKNNMAIREVSSDSRVLDLNVDFGPVNSMVDDNAPACIEESNKFPTSWDEKMECKDALTKCRGFNLDLNSEAISITIDDPFYPYKNYKDLNSRDDIECGSSVGPVDEKDSRRVWKELKLNNYTSTPHVALPMRIPKPQGKKKNNNDVMRRKMQLAKKQEVDRFARVAAPTGLLNGLNPGIINHVRNRKQVYSIIEAIARSVKTENQHSGSKENDHTTNCMKEFTERKEQEDVHSSEVNRCRLNNVGAGNDHTFFSKPIYLDTKDLTGHGDSYMGEARSISRMASQCNIENQNDGLELKLWSEESENCTSLSVKASSVASKWLELLNQDTRGRLAALRRSKKRVSSVIATNSHVLNSREFSSDLDEATVDEHSIMWTTLFVQMYKKLSEEEDHLENWLNQVKEMQLKCERGL